jgi:hypothetical protein
MSADPTLITVAIHSNSDDIALFMPLSGYVNKQCVAHHKKTKKPANSD